MSLCVCLVDQPPKNSYSYSKSIVLPFFFVEFLKTDNLHLRSPRHNQHRRNPYNTAVLGYYVAQQCLWNHTLPHLSRRTLNDLQRNQHEKSWLLFVRAQDPSETVLGAVYIESGGQTWPKKTLTHTQSEKLPVIQDIFYLFIYPPADGEK